MLDEFFEILDPAILVATVGDGSERDGCVVGFATQCSITRSGSWSACPS